MNTAEHELGHAIGLDHNGGESVMQPAGSFYSIQDSDVEAVRQLYKEEWDIIDQLKVLGPKGSGFFDGSSFLV